MLDIGLSFLLPALEINWFLSNTATAGSTLAAWGYHGETPKIQVIWQKTSGIALLFLVPSSKVAVLLELQLELEDTSYYTRHCGSKIVLVTIRWIVFILKSLSLHGAEALSELLDSHMRPEQPTLRHFLHWKSSFSQSHVMEVHECSGREVTL